MKLKAEQSVAVGQLLTSRFKQAGLSTYQVARDCGLFVSRLYWLAHGRGQIGAREITALGHAFGAEFAAELLATAGYPANHFARLDKTATDTARWLRADVIHLRAEIALNEAEADAPELRTAVLRLLDQCDRHLDGWTTYHHNDRNRANDLLTAAEHLYKAADLTYRASHPPVRPYEQWAVDPPHRHRYPVAEDDAMWWRPSPLDRTTSTAAKS